MRGSGLRLCNQWQSRTLKGLDENWMKKGEHGVIIDALEGVLWYNKEDFHLALPLDVSGPSVYNRAATLTIHRGQKTCGRCLRGKKFSKWFWLEGELIGATFLSGVKERRAAFLLPWNAGDRSVVHTDEKRYSSQLCGSYSKLRLWQ
jgi:hypothetical protein